MTIMIVDDNQAMRKTIRSVAAENSDSVIECENGADAVLSFGLYHPDWVLMDINLPVLDGISATRQIMDEHPAARVVMVSDMTEPGFRSAAEHAGACGYVSKENLFELSELMRK
jgi:two-component system response regulator DegU